MKKNLLFIFCFLSSLAFSQDLIFDYLIEVERTEFENHTYTYLYNSKTDLNIPIRKIKDKYLSSVYDDSKNLLHYHHIYERNGVYTSIYSDSYVYTKDDFSRPDKTARATISNFKVNKIDDLTYIIENLDRLNNKEVVQKVKVILESFSFNFFNLRHGSSTVDEMIKLVESEISDEINHYKVSQYEVTYKKYREVYKIKTIKNIDLKLEIPTKLNLKSL